MAEAIRFYLDEHLPGAVAKALRHRGIDVLRAQDAGMGAAPDRDHLELAAGDGRVLVTLDADFVRLHVSGAVHAGIAYAGRQMAIGQIVRSLVLIHNVLTPDEMKGRVEFL